MDDENGQLPGNEAIAERHHRSAGWLARGVLSAAILLGVSFGGAAFAQEQQLPTVTVAKPVVREIVEDDEFVGRFEAVDEVAIRSRVGGYLDKVHFKDGAIVKQGRPAVHHRPAPLPGGLRRGQVAARCRQEPARLHRRRSSTAPRSSPSPATSRSSTLDDRRREYLSAQAQIAGRDGGAARPPASISNSPRSRRRWRAASTAGWSRSAISCRPTRRC